MNHKYRILPLICAALVVGATASSHAQSAPVATAQRLCDALIGAMKQGKALGFAARRDLLAPEIRRDMNLPLMTRIVVGSKWLAFTSAERDGLVQAFSDFSIANYASRFSAYSGERFVVDPAATTLGSGDVIVKSTLVPKGGDPVHLDYLMRQSNGQWQVIDVFLSGTISELAARRSEYSAVLKSGGAGGLIELLRKKTAEISG
ncbi:MAG: ABC transporter substrate-binding protein [Opitutaceae bacterium]|jgi:phospholipid transport system substrate-binding protein